jgi:hypothetical protein
MAQEKQTPGQMIEAFMIKNNMPISSELLSYLMATDMYFRKRIETAFNSGKNDQSVSADQYYFMTYIDND